MQDNPRLAARVMPAQEHGKAKTYRKGCRCEPCREAKTVENQRYRSKNREKMRASDRAYYQKTIKYQSERNRDRNLRRKYGIGTAEYLSLSEFQSARCALCARAAVKAHPSGDPLVVDHDHGTGKVRGLLCYPCNTQLGWAENGRRSLTPDQAEYLEFPPFELWRVA